MMQLPELHLAVRDIVQRAGLQTFFINLQIHEEHPNRVEVVFSVYVYREEPLRPVIAKSREAALVLEQLRNQLAPLPAPHPLDELVEPSER